MTLNMWKITPPEGGLWSESSVLLTTFDTAGQIDGIYTYLDEGYAGAFGVNVGWYTSESVDGGTFESADNAIIPFKAGVQIGSDCGATVTSAGVVLDEPEPITINDESVGGFTWTGNCSPLNQTLKEFTVIPPEGGLWSESSVLLTTFDTAGQIDGIYTYLDEGYAGAFGVNVGWYTSESVDGGTFESAGDIEIVSGQMFQIGSDCGATLTVPSAL